MPQGRLQATISAATKIKATGADLPTILDKLEVWSSADGSLTITDGTTSLVFYTQTGPNHGCPAARFAPGADLTLTPSDPMTVFADYHGG